MAPFKLKIAKTYEAILSTPLGVGDVALGELTWSLLRGGLYSGTFLCVMAGTTFMRSWQDFDMVSLAIIPFFLFSATFYPLSVYPGWLQVVVRCTPLYQGVALLRGFDLGQFGWSLAGHAAYLAAMGLAGLVVSTRRLGRLLLP